jgi:type II secretion system-associated lipoprotein
LTAAFRAVVYLLNSMSYGEIQALKRLCAAIVASLVFVPACDVFVPGKEIKALEEREKKIYVMKSDLEVGGKKLKKGEEVRLKITTGNDWLKVRAFPARVDELKADYVLLLYIFDEDFEKKMYSADYFAQRLSALVTEKGAAPVTKAPGAKKK